MPAQYIPFGSNAYDASDFDAAGTELENWYAEEAVENPSVQTRLLPIPGLVSFVPGFIGPVRGMGQFGTLLGGLAVVVAGTEVYTVTDTGTPNLIGTVTGTEAVRFSAAQGNVVLVAGGTAYVVTATSITAISVPGATGPIVDVDVIAQRHLFVEGASGRLWFSDVNQPAVVPANSFVTAEAYPDLLMRVRVIGANIYLIGETTSEIWEFTGSLRIPFRRIHGAIALLGIASRGALTLSEGAIYAVGRETNGNERVFAVQGTLPQAVSTSSIDRLIQRVAVDDKPNITLTNHSHGGHNFIGLHLPSVGDYFLNLSTGMWDRRKEFGSEHYMVATFMSAFGRKFAGGQGDNWTLFEMHEDVFTHDNNYVHRVATAFIPVMDGRPSIKNLTVEMQTGVGLNDGNGVLPVVYLKWAKDGRHYGNEVTRTLGLAGEYGHRVTFGSMGRLQPPFVKTQIRIIDPINAIVSGVVINRDRL